jgi:hypothetical protein
LEWWWNRGEFMVEGDGLLPVKRCTVELASYLV